jgi:cytochrome c biogenesis protein CcmG, thiol:disulfide interchange protein DsbE
MTRLLATFFIAVIIAVSAAAQTRIKPGDQAPAFSVTSIEGTPYQLDQLKGSVVVLTFWSTRCEICRVEFPRLNQLTDVMRQRGVVFLSLTLDNEQKVEQYLRSNRITSNIVANSFGVLLQYADRDRRGYVDMGFPAYFVIDQDGRVSYRASGWDKTTELSSRLTQLLSTGANISRQ